MNNNRLIAWTALTCLLGTLFIGVWLRWTMAGVASLGSFHFGHMKHAHSHLGYFGVIFPLLWATWSVGRRFQLAKTWLVIYLVGIVLSTIGLARAGYKPDAIIGSTLVLMVWLISAWRQKHHILKRDDWLSVAPLGIVLGSLCIPPIAIFTRRDPLLAAQLVKTFLSLLLFLVALPSFLDRLNLRAPPMVLWLICGSSGALFLGLLPHWWFGLGLAGMALWLQWGLAHQKHLPLDLRFLWLGWSFGGMALGLSLLSNTHNIAIAGLHFTILGPLLSSAWWILAPRTMTKYLRGAYHGFVFLMVTAIAAPSFHPHAFWPTLSAAAGTGVVCCVGWMTFLVVRRRTVL